MGIPARRAVSRSFLTSETGPSRSQASGDCGSVNPRVMSMTTRAGRRPKPPRPPNPSRCAKVLPPFGPRLAELAREPLVERAARLGNHTPLLVERRQVSVVEPRRLATATPYLLTLRACRFRVYGVVVTDHDAVDAFGGPGAYEAPADVLGHGLGVAFERVSDATGSGRLEDEAVAFEDGHIAHLGRHLDLVPVRPEERLLRRRARLAAVHAVGVGVVAVVLVCDAAVGQETVDLLYPAAAPELAGAAGVFAGRVLLHDHGVVRLHVLGGNGEELGPPGVSVEAVLAGDGRDPAVQDLHGLERLSVLLDARVDEVGARSVGAGDVKAYGLGVHSAEDVELPCHDDQAVAQGGRLLRAQDRAVRDVYFDDVRVAVVEEDGGIYGGDKEYPREHLEHLFVEEEVDGAWHLRVGAAPVEVQSVALAPHGEPELYGAVAEPIVVSVVLELETLVLRYELADQVYDARTCPVQKSIAGLQVRIFAEPVADVSYALSASGRSCGYGHNVGAGLARGAGVVAEEAQDLLVEFTSVVELDGRHPDARVVDGAGVDGDGTGGRAADIHEVAPLQGVADVFVFVEDWPHQQDVRQVRRAPLHHVRVVEGNDIAIFQAFDRVRGVLQDGIHGAPDLAYDHAALAVGYEGELVGLLADNGANSGRDEHPVHLEADVLQGILDNVEGHIVYVVFPDEIRPFLLVQHHLLCLLDQDIPEAVYGPRVAWLYDRCGVVLYDDSRTRNGVSGSELTPVVDWGLDPPAVEVHLLGARDGARGILPGPILALEEADTLYGASPDDAYGGDLQRRVGQIEVIALPVRLLEPPAQEGAVAILQLLELEATGDLDVLQVVAAVGVQVKALVLFGDALALEPFVRLRDKSLDSLLELGSRGLPGDAEVRLGKLVLDVGGEEAERAHHAGGRGYDNGPGTDQTPQGVGVHRTGPAERDEPEVSRVVPALDAHDAQGGVHVLVDDLHNSLGRLLDANPELLRDGPYGPSRRLLVHFQRTAQGDARRDAVQNDVRIGYGRRLATAPVGRRSRVGAGARGADLQGATRGDERDRTSSRANTVNVHGGRLELEVPQLDVAPNRRLAAPAQRDVGRRAAHVEGQDVGNPDLTRQVRGPGNAARRPERAIWIGLSATASVLIAPPSERTMESVPPNRFSSMDPSKFLMYSMVRGCTVVFTTVVSVRSYSPYSCPISAEMETERSGCASRTMSRARRSCAGFT